MTLPAQEAAPTAAERRAARRANQTTFNLVLALLASLGLVILLVVVVVRPDVPRPTEDWAAAGSAAQQSVDETLAIPELPEGWTANRARLVTSPGDGVTRWEIGFLTPAGEYLSLVQGLDANPSWLASEVAEEPADGTLRLDGLTWDRHDRRTAPNPGNVEYALSTVVGASTIVLAGTADDAEFETLAAAVAESLS